MRPPTFPPTAPAHVLVCFAVREEAKRFLAYASATTGVETIITGMGPRNAERAVAQALDRGGRKLVLTCGFAGALCPELALGTVVYEEDPEAGLGGVLASLGAVSARFYCSARIAATAEEKRLLRAKTSADAIEMESGVIRRLCRERGVPSATVRVVSDTADEDLPLDFNTLLTPTEQIDYRKLVWALLRSPAKLAGLWRLQQHTSRAAEVLGRTLGELLRRKDAPVR